MTNSRRVLFVAYQFPPVGGAGVQRTTKFIKYLPRYGWAASVLTVANPSVPVFDHAMTREVPDSTLVRRARTFEPGYALKQTVSTGKQGETSGEGTGGVSRALKQAARWFASMALQPDPQVLWLPAAFREGLRLLRKRRHDAILATAPPFSALLLGAALSRRTGLPLVLDYRDEWKISRQYWENKQTGQLSSRIQERMQKRVLRAAQVVLATTRASALSLRELCAEYGSAAAVDWIYNGYDSDDFPCRPAVPGRRPGYRLSYVGTLWNLTSVEPLVDAVRQLSERRRDLADRLELVFVGRRTPQQQQFLDSLCGGPVRLVEYPYVEHHRVVDLLLSSNGLCALLSDVPGAERVVPAKIFECMAARRSIFAIAPPGEMWDILGGYPAAFRLHPRDVGGIRERLATEIERQGDGHSCEFAWDGSKFDRNYEAAQLASILNRLPATGGSAR
jgi:glycosyltransferase involved in cell wall biosynthesis